MANVLTGCYIDPIDIGDPTLQLVNLATGAAATSVVQKFMLNALDMGFELLDKFIEEQWLGRMAKRKASMILCLDHP